MEIRELGEADATEYRELRLRALREHPESFLSSYEAERARPETEVAARLARSAESPDDFILGCYVDDELVGMIGFSRDDREKQRHRGFIWGMHVTSEMQRRGLGRALLMETTARARAIPGIERVRLAVMTRNVQARTLYISVGFEVYSMDRRAMYVNGQYLDEELMVLELGRS